MKIILDTNFLVACMKNKLDFVSRADELFSEPINFVVPEEVVEELKKLSKDKKEKQEDKSAADLALKFIDEMDLDPVSLGIKPGQSVDDAIISHASQNKAIIATLDKGLKSRFTGKILTLKDTKSLQII